MVFVILSLKGHQFVGFNMGGDESTNENIISLSLTTLLHLISDKILVPKEDFKNPKRESTKSGENGKTIGDIVLFTSESKILGDLPHKEAYEKTSKAVGRIFVSFKIPNKKELSWFGGTGFCVKKDLVMTAAHVTAYPVNINAPLETQEMQRNLKHEKIYIFFGTDATTESEVDLENINPTTMYELESYGKLESNYPLVVSGDDNKQHPWHPNDLEVLKFKGKPPTDIDILFPILPTDDRQVVHYAMGYPNYVNLNDFVSSYGTSDTNNLIILYTNVSQQSRNFEKKTIFIEKIAKFRDHVISHHCPTLKGVSGGILAISQHERKFVGVHLGGNSVIGNFAISVTHPTFWHLYKTFVLDGQFIKENYKHLEDYLNYFKYTSPKKTF
ncbi:hypothetical protein PPL_06836 [Heterostelium album PN500]|uniref:Serine protease n=1 Tax=Heterostelium pallidum (strain ATCC 26659 / Pp 5 / PN500) TaxID=670386 RepID=D3BDN4_HETP5|nr:hypothetical protein PPL_06836 [Heterostelium album PN500]EFA80015.1 hypothetical protein PPL_06836 [Heterostelium album PN500]|eukprot:XP_020432135.1 hypothetical protein PPL_06836 [Heterostelium album PN500]